MAIRPEAAPRRMTCPAKLDAPPPSSTKTSLNTGRTLMTSTPTTSAIMTIMTSG